MYFNIFKTSFLQIPLTILSQPTITKFIISTFSLYLDYNKTYDLFF